MPRKPSASGISRKDAKSRKLLQDSIQAFRCATQADPDEANAWCILGVTLGEQADKEPQPTESRKLRQMAIEALRRATQANPDNAQAWSNLGFRLGQEADQEPRQAKNRKLRQEAIRAFRRATQANPELTSAWDSLCGSLLILVTDTGKRELIEQAVQAGKKAASLGASHYNFACALAVAGQIDEALNELEGCLKRNEIKASHVKSDPDWKALREDNQFREILSRYE